MSAARRRAIRRVNRRIKKLQAQKALAEKAVAVIDKRIAEEGEIQTLLNAAKDAEPKPV